MLSIALVAVWIRDRLGGTVIAARSGCRGGQRAAIPAMPGCADPVL
jgi:hypothetical protein